MSRKRQKKLTISAFTLTKKVMKKGERKAIVAVHHGPLVMPQGLIAHFQK
jgi:hypothetical protein